MVIYDSFEDYWTMEGSREWVADHEERARRAWKAAIRSADKDETIRRINAQRCTLNNIFTNDY